MIKIVDTSFNISYRLIQRVRKVSLSKFCARSKWVIVSSSTSEHSTTCWLFRGHSFIMSTKNYQFRDRSTLKTIESENVTNFQDYPPPTHSLLPRERHKCIVPYCYYSLTDLDSFMQVMLSLSGHRKVISVRSFQSLYKTLEKNQILYK